LRCAAASLVVPPSGGRDRLKAELQTTFARLRFCLVTTLFRSCYTDHARFGVSAVWGETNTPAFLQEATSVSIVRIGLAETKKFSDGYDAIFGKKQAVKDAPKAAKKPAGKKKKTKKK
jgi:hypothetical protein